MYEVKTNSLHYRWLVFYRSIVDNKSPDEVKDDLRYGLDSVRDFCAYWRAVLLWPLIRISANLFAWGVVIGTICALISTGAWVLFVSGVGIALGAIFVILALTFLTMYVEEKIKEKKKNMSSDTFIIKAWDSYKNKYCEKIVYKD